MLNNNEKISMLNSKTPLKVWRVQIPDKTTTENVSTHEYILEQVLFEQ